MFIPGSSPSSTLAALQSLHHGLGHYIEELSRYMELRSTSRLDRSTFSPSPHFDVEPSISSISRIARKCTSRHQPVAQENSQRSSGRDARETPSHTSTVAPRTKAPSTARFAGSSILCRGRLQRKVEPKVGPIEFIYALYSGSYGTAYAARDLTTRRVFCAKVCVKEPATGGKSHIEGLKTELAAYKRIANANARSKRYLMELYGVVQDAHYVVFAMDLAETDMWSYLSCLPDKNVIRMWLAQIAIGIDALHRIGIIHRDIKCENVLISPGTGFARITDFTNAWVAPGNNRESLPKGSDLSVPLRASRFYTREYQGTPGYIAPEADGRTWYGILVDWWSLGCLAFDLFSGTQKVKSESPHNKIRQPLFEHQEDLDYYVNVVSKETKKGTPDYYVNAKQRRFEYFAKRVPHLTNCELNLLCGLLHVDPDKRFRLSDLERHPYFLEVESGVNVLSHFRWDHRVSRRAPHVVDVRPSNSRLRPPLFYPQSYCWAEDDDDTFSSLRWINPHGIWASPQ